MAVTERASNISPFWKRQLQMLEGALFALIFYGLAGLTSWATGLRALDLVAGIALYMACAAYVRATK